VASYVPGNIWKVLVEAGQHVKAGDPLAIVESMKMEFTVTAPEDGEVLSSSAAKPAPSPPARIC
jgi:urea carboxylase